MECASYSSLFCFSAVKTLDCIVDIWGSGRKKENPEMTGTAGLLSAMSSLGTVSSQFSDKSPLVEMLKC